MYPFPKSDPVQLGLGPSVETRASKLKNKTAEIPLTLPSQSQCFPYDTYACFLSLLLLLNWLY